MKNKNVANAHDILRHEIQGTEYNNFGWATEEDIYEVSRKLGVVISLVNTGRPVNQEPELYYAVGEDKHTISYVFDDIPEEPKIHLGFTGNHFMSDITDDETRQALQISTSASAPVNTSKELAIKNDLESDDSVPSLQQPDKTDYKKDTSPIKNEAKALGITKKRSGNVVKLKENNEYYLAFNYGRYCIFRKKKHIKIAVLFPYFKVEEYNSDSDSDSDSDSEDSFSVEEDKDENKVYEILYYDVRKDNKGFKRAPLKDNEKLIEDLYGPDIKEEIYKIANNPDAYYKNTFKDKKAEEEKREIAKKRKAHSLSNTAESTKKINWDETAKDIINTVNKRTRIEKNQRNAAAEASVEQNMNSNKKRPPPGEQGAEKKRSKAEKQVADAAQHLLGLKDF